MRMLPPCIALTLALGLAPAPAHACPEAPPDAAYTIHHESRGAIGRHVISFACRGRELIVETAIEGDVTVLGIPVFRRQAGYHEVWQGDLLIAFESHFVDNGKVYEVSAHADRGQTLIDGLAGPLLAPPTVVSNHPWNHAVVDRTLLFDTREGALQRVQVEDAGVEPIAVGGREVEAHKYVVSGDLEREL